MVRLWLPHTTLCLLYISDSAFEIFQCTCCLKALVTCTKCMILRVKKKMSCIGICSLRTWVLTVAPGMLGPLPGWMCVSCCDSLSPSLSGGDGGPQCKHFIMKCAEKSSFPKWRPHGLHSLDTSCGSLTQDKECISSFTSSSIPEAR